MEKYLCFEEKFSSLYRYFIFINRADYNTNVYDTKAEYVSDLKNNKGNSGTSMRQTILLSQNQHHIFKNVLTQRLNNGPSKIVEKRNLNELIKKDKINRKSFIELQNEKMDMYPLIDENSFYNTLTYLYETIGEGIFVKIKNGILVSFLPFIKSNNGRLELLQMENNNYEFSDKVTDKTSHVAIQFNCCNITTDSAINYISKKYSMLKMYLLEVIRFQIENSSSKSISDVEFFINTSNCYILQEELEVDSVKNIIHFSNY